MRIKKKNTTRVYSVKSGEETQDTLVQGINIPELVGGEWGRRKGSEVTAKGRAKLNVKYGEEICRVDSISSLLNWTSRISKGFPQRSSLLLAAATLARP